MIVPELLCDLTFLPQITTLGKGGATPSRLVLRVDESPTV
jgi:hypothetical protein